MTLYVFFRKTWLSLHCGFFFSVYLKFKNYSDINMYYMCNKIRKKHQTFNKSD